MTDLLPDAPVPEKVQQTLPSTDTDTSREEVMSRVMQAVPSGKRSFITKDYIERLCTISDDPTEQETIVNHFEDFSTILDHGNYSMELYLTVVAFSSFFVCTGDRIHSFAKAKPEVYDKMILRGASSDEISARVSMFMSGKLCKKVLQSIHTPIPILYRSELYKSIGTLVALRDDEKSSPRIKMECAAKLTDLLDMDHLVDNDFLKGADPNQVSELTAVLKATAELASSQFDAIKNGTVTATQVAGSPLDLVDKDQVARDEANDAIDADWEIVPDAPK